MFNGFMSSSSLSKSVTTLLCCTETGGVLAPEWQKLTGDPKPVLSENLEGWDGEGGRSGVQVGGDTCIPMASVWQNHHNVVIILQLKFKKKIFLPG